MDDNDCEMFSEVIDDESFSQKLDEDLDFALALSLQYAHEDDSIGKTHSSERDFQSSSISAKVIGTVSKNNAEKPVSIVDEAWEVLDPVPDIHALFLQFNATYFWGSLNGVEVRWSPRMTLCAGVCCYEGRGGFCSVRLSQPLLKFRPRRDLVETLLHEMIHAYLFVTHNNKDHDAHGPEFLKHMNRINKETGTRISVYHSFHDEVDIHRKHWWKCDGPCQHRRPFYGLVKRAMNRAPAPTDPWWAEHQATCGGTYKKIKEPENYGQKKGTKRIQNKSSKNPSEEKDIRQFFPSSPTFKKAKIHTLSDVNDESGTKHSPLNDLSSNYSIQNSGNTSLNLNNVKNSTSNTPANVHTVSSLQNNHRTFVPFSGKGVVLGSGNSTPNKNALNSTVPSSRYTSLDKKLSANRNNFKVPKKNVSSKSNLLSALKTPGTGILSKTSGSRTITVHNPKHKANSTEKIKTPGKSKNIYFTGTGHVLGETSCTQHKSPDQPKTTLSSGKQESIETFFSRTSSNVESNNKKHAFIFSSDSEDDEIKIISQPNATITIEDLDSENLRSEVHCPVCNKLVQREVINNHLDSCLQNKF